MSYVLTGVGEVGCMYMQRAYLAAPDRTAELLDELAHAGARVVETSGRIVVTEGGPKRAAWAANVWLEPEYLTVTSIRNAAAQLARRGTRWASYAESFHRRTALIEGALRDEGCTVVAQEPFEFGGRAPSLPLGSWAPMSRDRLLASARCTARFPNGEVTFVEDRRAPPSRAYLKLWELFTLLGRWPSAGDSCLDLGSSPGGWTWVLATLGARVVSVDKAPLDPMVAHMPHVRFRQASAFSLNPEEHEPVDWLFSDVICYPSRLLECVERWLDAGKARNLVCTLKFQGRTDLETARRFARIPGSGLAHLHHNRHELTWWRLDPRSRSSR